VELPPSKRGGSYEFELPAKYIRDAEVYLYAVVREFASFGSFQPGQASAATTTQESFAPFSVTRKMTLL
jgi:hypothetical protein